MSNFEHFSDYKKQNKELFQNKAETFMDYSLDNNSDYMTLLLHALLFGCIFYILQDPETLKFLIKHIPQINKSNGLYVLTGIFVFIYLVLSNIL